MRACCEIVDEEIARDQFHDDAEKNAVAAQRVNEDVAYTGAPAAGPGIVPDEEGRGDGFHLPEAQKRDPVVRQHDADGRADISHGAERF